MKEEEIFIKDGDLNNKFNNFLWFFQVQSNYKLEFFFLMNSNLYKKIYIQMMSFIIEVFFKYCIFYGFEVVCVFKNGLYYFIKWDIVVIIQLYTYS